MAETEVRWSNQRQGGTCGIGMKSCNSWKKWNSVCLCELLTGSVEGIAETVRLAKEGMVRVR